MDSESVGEVPVGSEGQIPQLIEQLEVRSHREFVEDRAQLFE